MAMAMIALWLGLWVTCAGWPRGHEGGLQAPAAFRIEVSTEAKVGRPLLIKDLPAFQTRCFPVKVPTQDVEIRVAASVVGLAGLPVLSHGWEPTRPMNASATGYETVDQVVANTEKKPKYFFCVTTFSFQGCDSMLTVLIITAEDAPPPVQLRPNFPSIWPLGNSTGPSSMAFSIEVTDPMEDTRITAVPLSGEVDVEIYYRNFTGCSGTPIKVSKGISGPGVVDIHQSEGFQENLCILVKGQGVFSLTAGPRFQGPFLVPDVPFAGLLGSACERTRIWVNNGTDITVTVAADDASALTLSAMLSREMEEASIKSRWKGLVPPGGSGAALVISGTDVADVERSLGLSRKEVAVSLSTCRQPDPDEAPQDTTYWITSATQTGVVTLQDGTPAHTFVAKALWRDFRVLISGGKEITAVASAQMGQLTLVADTVRHPLQPERFRWASNGNSSRAVLHLTTDKQLVSSEVHLVDCRLPCFLYLSAHVSATGDEELPIKVVVSSDLRKITRLPEGDELEQRLMPKQSKTYEYFLRRNDTAAVISVTKKTGGTSFRVSSTPDFSPGPATTARAEAVILLEATSAPFMSAVGSSQNPVLYVRIDNDAPTSSSFLVSARSEGHAKWLYNGVPTQGANKAAGRYDRYRFFVSPSEALENLTVTIEVALHTGSVGLFAACDPIKYPDEKNYTWSRRIIGHDTLSFNSSESGFRPGWIYLSITSEVLAAYNVRVRWGTRAVEQLEDGDPKKSSVQTRALRWFSLDGLDLSGRRPVSLVAQALDGTVGLCVREYLPGELRTKLGLSQQLSQHLRHFAQRFGYASIGWMEEHSCVYAAMATSFHAAEDTLAALDLLPMSETPMQFAVVGLPRSDGKDESEFTVRALTGDVVKLPEAQTVVDTLGAPCCIKEYTVLSRSYRRFLQKAAGSLQIRVAPLGAGRLFPDGQLSLRARGSRWSETPGPLTVANATQEGILLHVDLKDLAGSSVRQGFWVEAHLEVHRPLNFSMSFQHDFAGEAQLPGILLPPNVSISGHLDKAEAATYSFQATEATLCLRQCFGQVELQLPRYGSNATTSNLGSVLGPQGNCTTLKDLPDGRGSALVMRSSSSADFEVELRRVSSTWDEKQIELADPVLFIADYKPCLGKSCEFSISVSFTSASIGLKDPDPGYSSEPKIRYLAVAMEEDPDLHANTSCGLRAAIDQHRTITKTSVQVQRNQHRLQGTLEFNSSEWANQTIKVNVLASLVLPDEKEVGVSGYCAARIVPKQLPASAGSRNDASIPYAAALLALIVMLWLLSRGRAKEARQAPLSEHIEMAYDLHEDGASRLLDHSGYVPPSV
ncbi:unnamed protein product [Durusdinium trenchii]|uniref:Uncharacterized protein n=1 Tax=Durusdinium trenchii TaxID=1381693 RepID=A0ABP0K4Y9_9DINO